MKFIRVLNIFLVLLYVVNVTEGSGSGGVAVAVAVYLTRYREKQKKMKEAALKRKTTTYGNRSTPHYAATPTRRTPVYCEQYGVSYGYGYRTNGFGYGYGPCVSWH
ncbi:unnamed protein product [Diamesa tonsa]